MVRHVKKKDLAILIRKFGQRYSELLNINLQTGDDEEIFKWFLAAVLFGAPITENSAIKSYRCFEKHDVLSPDKTIKTGWQGLVEILDEGSYTRYDYKTADKLLEVMGNLKSMYEGSLKRVHEKAADSVDLEKRLKELGKGIGDVTVSIFLRELRGIWTRADNKPTPLVILAARNLKIIRSENPEKAKAELAEFWKKNKIKGMNYVNFETALLRLGRDMRRRKSY